MPMIRVNKIASVSDDIDAAAISATPAPRTAYGKMRSRGSRRCTADTPTTPMATPVPRPSPHKWTPHPV